MSVHGFTLPGLLNVVTGYPPFAVAVEHGGYGFSRLLFILERGLVLNDHVLAIRRAGELGQEPGLKDLPVDDFAESRP